MGIWLAAFLVISVNQAGASLRESCDAGSQVVTFLGSGASLKLIYSVSGQAVPCYKVSAEINGKTVSGYLSATSMDGLDSFDKGRKEAAWIEVRPTSKIGRAHV